MIKVTEAKTFACVSCLRVACLHSKGNLVFNFFPQVAVQFLLWCLMPVMNVLCILCGPFLYLPINYSFIQLY